MQIKLHAALLLGIIYCLCDGNPTQAAGIQKITYTCDGKGTFTLNLTKVSSFSHFVITHVNITNDPMYGSNADSCTKNITTVADLPANKTVELSGCADHVYLYAMNHNKSLSILVGGRSFHKYDLQCVLPTKGVTVRVGQSFDNEIPSKTEVKRPDLNITMKFMKNLNDSSTTFKIGDGLKLDIKDKSAVTHTLTLKTCTSYSDKNHIEGKVKLFDRLSNGTESVHEREIFGAVNTSAPRDIFVDLRAFRYPTSNTVYMQCMVFVCNKNETYCGGKKTNRRRRSTDNSVHAVDGSFSVIDTSKSSKPKSSGQGTVVPCPMSVMSLVTVITTYMVMKSN